MLTWEYFSFCFTSMSLTFWIIWASCIFLIHPWLEAFKYLQKENSFTSWVWSFSDVWNSDSVFWIYRLGERWFKSYLYLSDSIWLCSRLSSLASLLLSSSSKLQSCCPFGCWDELGGLVVIWAVFNQKISLGILFQHLLCTYNRM